MMTAGQLRKNNQIAMAISVGLHAVLLLALLFLLSWKAPDPPLGGGVGVELNFGLDDQGGGDIQPELPPGPLEETPEKQEEQVQQEENVASQEEKPEEVISDPESPYVVKKEEPKKEPVKETPKEVEKPKTTPKEEPKKEDAKDSKTQAKTTDSQSTEKKGGGGTSHGDDPGKVGDKGNPEGKLDANALYGQNGKGGGGSGDGFGLSMSGWVWADQPKTPALPDNEDGRIEFEIECDEDGEIVGITTIQRGLSARAEQLLKEEIRKNSLMKTSAGKAPARSKGRVVFILKTK